MTAWMTALLLQGTLFLAAVLLVDTLLRRWAWPHLRGALWLLVPLKLLLPPAVASPAGIVAAPAPLHAPVWLLVPWLLGVVLLAAATVWRLRRLRRSFPAGACPPAFLEPLRRAAARLGLRRLPRVAIAGRSPAVFGVFRPVLVVPPDFPKEDLEHAFLHELAHVRRGDLAVQALFQLVQVVYWFHPLVWLARRRAHAVRELCCDATVAGLLREGTVAYRATLLRMAARSLGATAPGTAALVGAPSLLLQRLRLLGGRPWRRRTLRRISATAAALALAATVGAGSPADPRDVVRSAWSGGSCLELRHAVMNLMYLEEWKR